MPEAIVKITNKVLEKGKIKELTATLELPAPREQIEQALRELQVEGAGENGKLDVNWQGANFPSFYDLRWGDDPAINHIYEINHLAERVAALDDPGRVKLHAMCYRYLDEMQHYETGLPDYEPTVAHAINLTHNLDGIQIIEGMGDIRKLGHYCVSQGIPGFENLSAIEEIFINFDRVGRDYKERLDGDFIDGYFVYNLPPSDGMVRPYDGKSLLIEQKPDREPEEAPGQTGGMTMGGM